MNAAQHGIPAVVDLLWPRLTTALTGPAGAAPLAAKAAALAPIRRGGFECRLAAGHDVLDLQQCVYHKDGEPAHLLAHLQNNAAFGHPIWRQVRTLMEMLATDAQPWCASVAELWLEFDADGSDWLPSLFVGATPGIDAAARTAIWTALFEILRPPLPDALQRCIANFGARISHLGFMLGRGVDEVRVNIKNLSVDDAAAVLETLAWPGDRAAAAEILELVRHMDCHFTLCLDIGAAVAPSLGIECYPPSGERCIEQWARLLDVVVAHGLAAPEKAAALLAWPGRVAPQPGRSWPLDLLAESLVRTSPGFTHFDCHISHVKLGVRPQRPIEAKGYLWFEHRWQMS
jgi:hypothetical protein